MDVLFPMIYTNMEKNILHGISHHFVELAFFNNVVVARNLVYSECKVKMFVRK